MMAAFFASSQHCWRLDIWKSGVIIQRSVDVHKEVSSVQFSPMSISTNWTRSWKRCSCHSTPKANAASKTRHIYEYSTKRFAERKQGNGRRQKPFGSANSNFPITIPRTPTIADSATCVTPMISCSDSQDHLPKQRRSNVNSELFCKKSSSSHSLKRKP